MNQKDLSKLLRTVQKNVRCPQCGRRYSFSDIKIRGIVDMVCFLELVCAKHMPLIATVLLNEKTPNNNTITSIKTDDVIEVHKFLKGFKGNFEKTFKTAKKENKK